MQGWLRVPTIVCLWMGFGLIAEAQKPLGAGILTGEFKEEMSSDVEVSGQILVGMWIGSAAAPLDLENLRVRLENGAKRKKPLNVCITASTRDGLYFGQGTFSTTANARGVFLVVPKEGWRFRQRLEQYVALDFAPLMFVGRQCEDLDGARVTPSILDAEGQDIVVAINSRRAVQLDAWFSFGDQEVHGVCDADTSVRSTAFDTICLFQRIEVERISPDTISILRTPRIGPRRVDDFAVSLSK